MKTLKYAIRFLVRSKSYTIINLLGLAFSLACCIILLRYIHRELTVDTHCIDREQVYGVKGMMEGNQILGLAENSRRDSSFIDERSVLIRSRVTLFENDHVTYQSHRYTIHAMVADSAYFQLFPYHVVQGTNSLSAPESVLVMEDFARKVFGKENPVGKILRFSNGKDIRIEGVLAKPSNKRTFNFDIILSSHLSDSWDRTPLEFIRFTSQSAVEKVNKTGSYSRLVNPNTPDSRTYTFSLIPVKEMYWNQSLMYQTGLNMLVSGNLAQLYILSCMCFLIFFAGVINFVNLYMVSAAKRSRVYILRKIFGANAQTLFMQIFLENFLLIASAMFLAWVIMEIMQTPIQHLLGSELVYSPFDLIVSISLLLILPLCISGYAFKKCHKSMLAISIRSTGNDNRSIRSRMIFLFVQYVVTFILVSLSLYFSKQLFFMLNTDPGFRTEDIIQASLIYESKDYSIYDEENIRQRKENIAEIDRLMNSCPDIQLWTTSLYSILGFDYKSSYLNAEGESVQLNTCYVNSDFFKIFNIPMVEGSLPKTGPDSHQECIVVNNAALKVLGYTTCQGATILSTLMKHYNPDAQAQPINAVSADYYDGHISIGIRPTVYMIMSGLGGDYYQIACRPGKTQAVLTFLKNIQKKVYGTEDFKYKLLKDEVADLYKIDKQIASVYVLFAFIAILIICLGLFGISLFDIRQRYREIAIRKVNGAGVRELYMLLFRKYVFVLATAFVVAIPLSSYCIYLYTQDFVMKASVGISIYLISLCIVAFVSLGTLLWQIRKAANINPATIMKTE
ncbi:ABC transporter permease [Bacteroides sp.]|uniref:ABC transporter permease n=1 Tax=Bacteroides sp. TaxID=29523 RepID=UPI00262711A3|nr:ABC transporter permease [Bacteroides sp.]